MIVSLIYVGMFLVLGAWPIIFISNEKFFLRAIGGIDISKCYSLILLLSAILTVISLQRGLQALKGMEI